MSDFEQHMLNAVAAQRNQALDAAAQLLAQLHESQAQVAAQRQQAVDAAAQLQEAHGQIKKLSDQVAGAAVAP